MDYTEDTLLGELRHWPDVQYEIEAGGKHFRLRVRYKSETAFMPFSRTKVCRRGMLNARATLRKTLAAMGATRC